MKILSLDIEGLNGSEKPISLTFNQDINIITGKNGSGKTTILKLLWYCVSANIERAIREITFSKVVVKTSKYTLIVEITNSKDKELARFLVTDVNGEVLLDKKEPTHREDYVELANRITVDLFDTSIFFPTFRRIEGGFSMDGRSSGRRRVIRKDNREFYIHDSSGGREIQDALESHAGMLSVENHKFVSSISTIDIQQLVTRKHSDATRKVEQYSKSLSETIFKEIKDYRDSNSTREDALKDAISTLDKINQDVIEFDGVREKAFKSLDVLSNMIVSIFEHKGIRLNPRVTLGDITDSIDSDSLSAGEKQMLSFLCYNALHSNCPFFIDEPELSLHVDWQRVLLDIMVEQGTSNQLFIATHSPFIYSQFEDKEIMIGNDKGNSIE